MILVNGRPQDYAGSVEDLVLLLGVGPRGVAVAIDGEVVPRSQWAAARVTEGARVEVVGAVQGG